MLSSQLKTLQHRTLKGRVSAPPANRLVSISWFWSPASCPVSRCFAVFVVAHDDVSSALLLGVTYAVAQDAAQVAARITAQVQLTAQSSLNMNMVQFNH